ncbi:MAG: iron-containing alcohol dehydrogenase [Thaumarchaeota archaeon]|nr:iron-containing alcohol dehydrogenase [Nitrososphaerota archaeon]
MISSAAFPRRLIFGEGSIDRLPEVLRDLGLKGRVMLVTGRRFARESGYLDRLRSLLTSHGMNVIVFDKVEPNPSVETIEEGGRLARGKRVDFVVSFGGGSAMDAAKGIAILAAQGGSLRDYYYPTEVKEPVLPIIAVPTTCGTGSEVTKYAVFSENLRKNVVASDRIVPAAAILDPQVLKHLPARILAHTAMDALAHALEAYFHVQADPLSETFSIRALELILKNFKQAYDGEMTRRRRLFYASMLAGFAINLTGTVIPHGLGYYLTERFKIPHGLATALFLSEFIGFAAEKLPERVVELAEELGFEVLNAEEAARMLTTRIGELKKHAGLPLNLLEASIPKNELQMIVEEGRSYRRNLENCQARATPEDIRRIVEQAFKGA